jgi:hypothetical protein
MLISFFGFPFICPFPSVPFRPLKFSFSQYLTVHYQQLHCINLPGNTYLALEIISVGSNPAHFLREPGGQRSACGRLLSVLAQRALSFLVFIWAFKDNVVRQEIPKNNRAANLCVKNSSDKCMVKLITPTMTRNTCIGGQLRL